MIVHFGTELDGLQPEPPRNTLGEIAAGPARLLELLELRLGLPQVSARPGEALLEYRACLADLDHEDRFYHRSFQLDPIGAARTLLDWRARWYEAGWQGRFAGAALSRRLADMSDVERIAVTRVPPAPGQRLQRVAAALSDGLDAKIRRIVLHDEPAALPPAWRSVLEHFDCGTADGVSPSASGVPGTDLHRVQQTLLALAEHEEGRPTEPAELAGDDSFVVVRGVSRDLSAQTLAEYLLAIDAPDDTVVIAERDGIILDNALERVGLPRAGFQHYSRFRAVTQVLKLGLGLLWAPASPQLLLQFLLHPVGPLPRFARSALAEAVASEPGVGGRAWREALERIAARGRTRPDGEPGDDAAAAKLLDDVRYWLEPEPYSPDAGAPIETLIDRAQRSTTWLGGRLHGAPTADRDLYAAAHGQGEALIAALESLRQRGRTRVGRIELEQLVDEVTGNSADPGTFAEARHVRATTEPATITRPWQTVVWWDLAAHAPRIDCPWSERELAELAAEGIALPSADEAIRAQSRAWQRPILNARRQCVLVVHDRDEGHHPLWSRLTSLVRGFNEIRVEDELLGGDARGAMPALGVPTCPLPLRPLPAPKRWWTLPPDCRLEPRDAESYSSLAKLIDHPHEWVLTYPARLRTGRAANLPGLPLLCGNLAHRVFQEFFEAFPAGGAPSWRDLDDAAVLAWLAATLPRIVAQEGAVLDEPGMGVTRAAALATIESALLELTRALKQAGIVGVAAEQWHDVPFVGVGGVGGVGSPAPQLRLRGAIDLLLTDARGREIVLDVKWGGQDRRGRELADNRALQLIAYAYMRRAISDGAAPPWPRQAYFIVTTANVVAPDTDVFAEAVEYPPADGEPVGADRVWARVCRAFDWRWAQLAAGSVECNAAGTAADDRSAAPDDALKPRDEPDLFDDFALLTGWEHGE
ncbi:MAG: PD-(D/E)XK nuclease family protein [Gammaproteobacteria bacterium]|nr:PD-(D/E)XK nuclease family protein [Gammaproteobacteria bacterium]